MKKMAIIISFAAIAAAFAGCGEAAKDTASAGASMVSSAASGAGEAARDVGEGVTAAVSAVTSEADRMMKNGQVSDGDGIIGNEDGTEDATEAEDMTEAEDLTETEDATDGELL